MPEFQKRVGSKAEVFHGVAYWTPGHVKREGLVKTKAGRIVSRKKQALGRKSIKRLFALGFKPKKGAFTLMRKSMAKHSSKHASKKGKRHTRKRGGFEGADLKEAFETKQ
jgi:hypothetical protein